MPSKKRSAKATATGEPIPSGKPASSAGKTSTQPALPFARYISLLGVHLILSFFSALYLPRSNAILGLSVDYSQTSSLDRPQHEFLAPLTATPALTLVWLVLGAMILQSWWSGWARKWWFELVDAEKAKAKKDAEFPAHRDLGMRKIRALKDAAITTLATSLLYNAIFMLFGAPLTSHYLHTYLLALLLAVLTVHTPAYTLGTPSFASDSQSLMTRLTWTRLFAELAPKTPIERLIVYPSVGSVLGCWAGVMPIPLDWDRPWQAWPLTPAYGAIFGQIVGSTCAAVAITWTILTEMGQASSS